MVEALPDAPTLGGRLPVELRGRKSAEDLARLRRDRAQLFDERVQLALLNIARRRDACAHSESPPSSVPPSIPKRLARLQHVRDALLRLPVSAEREERLALQIQKVLLGDARLVVEVAARQDARELLADDGVVVGDEAAALQLVYAELDGRERGVAERGHVLALARLRVARGREAQHFLLSVGDEAIRVHRVAVLFAQEAERLRLLGRGRDLRQRNRLERALDEGERVGLGHARRD